MMPETAHLDDILAEHLRGFVRLDHSELSGTAHITLPLLDRHNDYITVLVDYYPDIRRYHVHDGGDTLRDLGPIADRSQILQLYHEAKKTGVELRQKRTQCRNEYPYWVLLSICRAEELPASIWAVGQACALISNLPEPAHLPKP